MSIATVSRVINNSDRVSDKTRQKVLSIIEQEGYQPNAFARGLGLDSMRTVGIICSNSSDIFLASAIYQLEHGLRKHNYDSLLCCAGYDKKEKQNYINLLISKRVDAILLVGSDFICETGNNYIIHAAKKVPMFLLNGFLNAKNVYSVLCNDRHIVAEVTSDMISSGNDKQIFLNRKKSFGGMQKLSGFILAHEKAGISLENWQKQYIDGDIDEVVALLSRLKSDGNNFNGVITSDDELAVAAVKFARQNSINIPEDLTIVGYNNSRISRYCDPEISSIDNKLEYCCHSLITVLLAVLEGKSVSTKTEITAEFIKRETTK